MELENTAAIVTGGASGLGAATVALLARSGARVVILDLEAAIDSSLPIDGAVYLPVDITDHAMVAAAVAHANSDGRYPLRSIVSCAGIAPSARILGRDGVHDLALFAKVVEINLMGTFNVLALGAEQIAKNDELEHGQRGAIVNTASVAAFEGQIGQIAYASSKAGIVGMTLAAARDLAQVGVRVNTIAPGIVETPMLATVSDEYRSNLAAGVPFPKRLARPEEYAETVKFLLEHDYMNGETIRMDGALRMSPR
jgi:NAD(P)-dependent dehydrogenase (short-subunit alcohol dehydrogenase family)